MNVVVINKEGIRIGTISDEVFYKTTGEKASKRNYTFVIINLLDVDVTITVDSEIEIVTNANRWVGLYEEECWENFQDGNYEVEYLR